MSKRFTHHWGLVGLGLAAGVGLSLSATAAPDDIGRGVSDSTITAKVKATLADDSQLQGAHIRVKTEDRVVTLRGRVDSEAQRHDAVRMAREVRGVDSVDDELSVNGSRESDHPAVARAERAGSDSWITTKVKSELLSDTGTHSFKVHVTTLHGVVMLSGALPSEEDVHRVRDIAGQVQGVRRVDASELRVSGGG